METHLKLAYTAVTRCIEQLFFAETTPSDAGDAAVRWLTTSMNRKDQADGDALGAFFRNPSVFSGTSRLFYLNIREGSWKKQSPPRLVAP